MAITDTQKVDYLWKKIGYGRAKTDVNSVKNATNESIASPLLLRGEEIWAESSSIPAVIPSTSSYYVTLYPTSNPVECTADITASTNRTWNTGVIDWIPPEIGATYLIKVYLHTPGDPAGAASSGTQVFGAGSGSNDEWFFDYKSGVLNFIGTNLPSGISGKSVYISGAVYSGTKGISVAGAAGSFSNVEASGIATFLQGLKSSDIRIGIGQSNEIDTFSSDLILDSFTGQTIIDDNLKVTGVSTFVGSVTFEGGTINLGDSNSDNIVVGGEFSSHLLPDVDNSFDLGSASKQWRTLHSASAEVSGVSTFSDKVIFDSTNSIQIPVGTTAERDPVGTAVTGQIRYNTQLSSFEGYGPGGEWGSLGGVKDVDGDTFIRTESAAGADEDTLSFFTAGTEKVTIDDNGNVGIGSLLPSTKLDVDGTITGTLIDGDLNQLGNTYYVATEGSDSNSGNNINEPFLTVAQALSVAESGDIVNVSAGTFTETCPLVVPRGVTVKGAGLRATSIKPSEATKQENIFHLNDVSTIEDITVRDSFYDSSNDTGYAFAYAPGIAITTRSPYIQRVTVLNFGSAVTADDPYGYDSADSPPTSYIAGRGAKVDGSVVASNSLEAGMLFNEVTFFTPNSKGLVATNGARVEYLNCFNYFASQAVVGVVGDSGIGGNANAKLRFDNPSVSLSTNDVVKLYESGTAVAIGTVTSYSGGYARISGKGFGTFTSVGAGTTQDVRFFQSDGTTQTGTADAIRLADYKMFGAEMRSIGCAFQYGEQAIIADGTGVELRLFAVNFNHIGAGKDFSNDGTLTVQANETTELNNGKISYVSVDQDSNFRVGDSFVVNQDTGSVSFAATTYSLDITGDIDVTDGTNTSNLSPTSLSVGTLRIGGDTLSSVSGDININPAGSNETNVEGNLNVTGILTAAVLQVSAVQKGDTSIAIEDTGSNGTIKLNTDGVEALTVSNTQFVGIGSANPTKKLDVVGETGFTGGVTVSGVTTTAALEGFSHLQAPHSADTHNYSVTVVSKTAAHRYNGTGSSSGYAIDGVESPTLHLTPGRTYRFTLSSSDMSSHPFRFYLDAAKTQPYTTNVITAPTYAEIEITDTTPSVLHYQCSAHGYMGNSLITHSNAINTPYDVNVSGALTAASYDGPVVPQDDTSTGWHRVAYVGTAGTSDVLRNGGFSFDPTPGARRLSVGGEVAGDSVKSYYSINVTNGGVDAAGIITAPAFESTGGLSVAGVSSLSGNVIIGDNFFSDTVDFNASVASDLVPSTTDTYDLGSDSGNKWRDLYLDGKISAGGSITSASLHADEAIISDIQIGVTTTNEINTKAGNLVIDSASGTTTIDDNMMVTGVSTFVGVSSFLASNVYFSTDVEIGDDLTVVDNLYVGDNVEVADELIVEGESTFNDSVVFNEGVTFESSNISVKADWDYNNGELNFRDDTKIIVGGRDGSETEIYQDSADDFYIEGNTDTTINILTENSANVIVKGPSGAKGGGAGNYLARFDVDNGVELYWNGNGDADEGKKFETTGYGVDVTGRTNTDQLTVSGLSTFSGAADFNDAVTVNDIQIGSSANNEIDTAAGNLILDSATGMTYVDDDLTIAGSLFVQGSTTQVDTNSITVEDRTIELGIVNGTAPSSATTWDLGVLFNYNDGSAKKAAVAWESSVSRFVFGSQVADAGGTGNANPQLSYTAYAPVEIEALWINDCAGQSQVISCAGGERRLENITIDGGSF